jgi:hypothetical protein
VTLFAALDYLQGKVIAHTAQKHTHRQWLEFLKQIDREIPLSQHVHIILDNYSEVLQLFNFAEKSPAFAILLKSSPLILRHLNKAVFGKTGNFQQDQIFATLPNFSERCHLRRLRGTLKIVLHLELLSERAWPQLREPDNLRTFVSSPQ